MNQAQILSELKLDNCYVAKPYAAKLLSLLKLINELEKMDEFKVELNGQKGNYELVAAMPEIIYPDEYDKRQYYFERKKQQDNCKSLYGEFEQWQMITVKHSKGEYHFNFPMGNKFYNTFLGMTGANIPIEVNQEIKPLNTIVIQSEILKDFSKAIRFISKDDLRPAMMHVCLAMDNFKAELVGTDAHQLYQSNKVECSQKERIQLMINEKDAKIIAKIKCEDELTEINILPNNQISIEGQIFDIFNEGRYPDYRCVVPKYKTFMKFDKDKFASNVKKVLPSANKATNQVNFHLNGSIAMNACDIDFSYESNTDMPYISKTFIDTDIAFNGKFLLNVMSIFKDNNVKMFSDGLANRAGIFTNDKDSVLLMPLMLNN